MYNPEVEAWIKARVAAHDTDALMSLGLSHYRDDLWNQNNFSNDEMYITPKAAAIWDEYFNSVLEHRPFDPSKIKPGVYLGAPHHPNNMINSFSSSKSGKSGKPAYSTIALSSLKNNLNKYPHKNAVPAYNMGKATGTKIFAANREMTDAQKAKALAAYKKMQQQKKSKK